MIKRYYAVKRGHKQGIFESWEECQKATEGYSAPVFKGFKYHHEAVAFLAAKMPEWSGKHKKPVKQKPAKTDGKFKYASMKSGQVYKTTYAKDPDFNPYNGDLPPWQ